jgi:putative hydrolase of the HAD superfamily
MRILQRYRPTIKSTQLSLQAAYKHIFFDLDHTLWDFEANAKATLQHLYTELDLATRGVDDFELFYRNYLLHNEKLWERYRNGFIRQEELRIKRMRLSLLDFKIADEALAEALSVGFLALLPSRTLLFPHTMEVLDYLHNKGYALHLITNGFEKTQHSKLEFSGLTPYFKAVVTSEASGSLKPKPEIFAYALDKAGATAAESIMIGDTLEVDILGARNAGIHQVHVNHINSKRESLSDGSFPTFTIFSLLELKEIL